MRLITAFAIVVTTCVAGPIANGQRAMGDGMGGSAKSSRPLSSGRQGNLGTLDWHRERRHRPMPIALDFKAKDDKVSGALETGHGNWEVREVKKQEGVWVISIKAPDGLEGTMTGRVKDGKLTGDWNFKPRAVGTFALARPANSGK